MNYSDMSDFEINKAVADTLGFELSNYFTDNFGYMKSKRKGVSGCLERVPDYCNNPSDAWPIIVENLIAISPCYSADNSVHAYEPNGNWCAENFDIPSEQVTHKNPLRAAMIVFLMMNEENNGV